MTTWTGQQGRHQNVYSMANHTGLCCCRSDADSSGG